MGSLHGSFTDRYVFSVSIATFSHEIVICKGAILDRMVDLGRGLESIIIGEGCFLSQNVYVGSGVVLGEEVSLQEGVKS